MLLKKVARKKGQRGPRERGQILVEFALVGMIFFILMFGILDFVRLFQSWVTVQHAAREGARFAITGEVACSAGATSYSDDRPNCIVLEAKQATEGLTNGGATGTGVTVTIRTWPDTGSGAYGSVVDPDVTGGTQCDKIEVTVTYVHKFVAPYFKALAPSGITLNGKQKMINEPFGQCT